MSTFQIKHQTGSPTVEVAIDLGRLQAISKTGVRRAAAFIGVGLQAFQNGPPTSVAVGGSFTYRFLPEPLTEALGIQVRDEFTAWLVGNALRELDQHFGLFLDDAWDVIRLTGDVTVEMGWDDHLFDQKFRAGTNVYRKADQVSSALGCTSDLISLRSLSLARNALSHSVGRVRERDINNEEGLLLCWMAPVAGIEMGGEIHPFNPGLPSFEVTDPEGARVVVEFKTREKLFPVGTQIVLEPHELSEICFFYTHATDVIIQALNRRSQEHLRTRETAQTP